MNPTISKPKSDNRLVQAYLVTGGVIVAAMMVFGVFMLLAQSGVLEISPATFYQFLTIHGTGMIGAAALAASGVMWYFLNKHVTLSKTVFLWNLILVIIGVVLVVIGVFSFEYASAWTFLYPLPALSAGAWGTIGALFYLLGMLILGTGFLLLYIDTGRAIIKKYGSLFKGLGWDILFSRKDVKHAPPKTVIASTMVTIVNTTAVLAGATVIIMNIINVVNPAITFDPLLAKNLTFAFGHIFANAIIYMGVIVVYEVLPKYAKRQWGVTKLFLLAWAMSTVFTLMVYTHHMLMDSVMPRWMLIIGQVLSYANGLPVLIVTAYGALMVVHKSGIRWNMASRLALLAMAGWTLGVVPAIIDSTITVNHVMHNTQWVPGHFHMYMGLGAVVMLFSFMYYLSTIDSRLKENGWDKFAYYLYLISMVTISLQFLFAGTISTPRRWAVHFPEWMGPAMFGAIGGIALIVATSIFIIHFVRYIVAARKGSDHYEKKTA
jgi:cytochrome c oxidase subunit 1